ncbi:MAG: glycosyltransferase, partial [Crocinitomicaceae bacterium]|nr:glycosyltransferase [Crocinitomicaceae bacterium]
MKSEIEIDIRMTSWIKDIKTFNAGMDVICLTSDNEGTPVSLIEAQACNIPIVSTDVGGVRDIVAENETGYIVPKNDVNAFAEKLLLLTEDKNNRERMSQNGWSFVREKFHYTRLVN